MKYKVGFIGVGLMGHGIARNILKNGCTLQFLEHPGNSKTDDLIDLGADSTSDIQAITKQNDIIFLCVTGSPQVKEIILGDNGVLSVIEADKIVIDCSTIEPNTSVAVAAELLKNSAYYFDAPLTRTPKEAEEGRLNMMLGGNKDLFEKIKPLLQCFAENIYFVGPVGSGHTMKLLHNYISLGNCALLAEAAVCAQRGGIDMRSFFDVLASGGGDSTALKRIQPFVTNQDDSALKFSIANSHKDISYYRSMANQSKVATASQGIEDLFKLALDQNVGNLSVPHLYNVLNKVSNGSS